MARKTTAPAPLAQRIAERVELVGRLLPLAHQELVEGEPTREPVVGAPAALYSRGKVRMGIITKVGPKRVTVAYVTPGGIEERTRVEASWGRAAEDSYPQSCYDVAFERVTKRFADAEKSIANGVEAMHQTLLRDEYTTEHYGWLTAEKRDQRARESAELRIANSHRALEEEPSAEQVAQKAFEDASLLQALVRAYGAAGAANVTEKSSPRDEVVVLADTAVRVGENLQYVSNVIDAEVQAYAEREDREVAPSTTGDAEAQQSTDVIVALRDGGISTSRYIIMTVQAITHVIPRDVTAPTQERVVRILTDAGYAVVRLPRGIEVFRPTASPAPAEGRTLFDITVNGSAVGQGTSIKSAHEEGRRISRDVFPGRLVRVHAVDGADVMAEYRNGVQTDGLPITCAIHACYHREHWAPGQTQPLTSADISLLD